MSIEDRLRRAIDARTTTVEPALDDGLDRISQKLLSREGAGAATSRRTPWLLAAAAIVLLAAVAGGLVLAGGDDSDQVDTIDQPGGVRTTQTTAPDETPGSTAPGTTQPSGADDPSDQTTTTTTAPQAAPPADVLELAVWPRPSSDVRFDEPVAAAQSFALYLAQFEDPVLGEFRPGDGTSGEVPVQPTENGPETRVLVRRLSDGNWYVTGSTTDDISVDQPGSGTTLGSPQALSGRALAFEGTVQVQLLAYRPDGRSERLGQTFVTGSGSPPAGPFTGSLDWGPGSADLERTGVVVFWTSDESEQVGGSWQVVAIPVRLG